MIRAVLLLASATLLAGCASTPVEAHRLDGTPLARIEPSGERRAHYENELALARARWEAERREEDAIWVGRHLGYLGRYREAIDWYTARLEDFPVSAKLLRHRGHRWISVRAFDRAIVDLEQAHDLVAGTPDEIEPDGAPNELGIPRSTLQTNIDYHLALACFLQGDFARAERAWSRANAIAPNDDSLVSSLHWQVRCLRRLGREQEAREAVAPVRAEMDVIENHAYHRLLLLERGDLAPEELLGRDADAVQDATTAYGVSLWLLAEGREEEAEALWHRIVAGEAWSAFGHIAAEAELARLASSSSSDE